jgi:outer membrane lipoprotein-sorting protein
MVNTDVISRLAMRYGWLIGLVLSLPQLGTAQSATDIVRRADELLRGESSRAAMTMTIVRPNWTRTVELTSWSKGTALSMILIEAPARDKGTVFLKRRNEIWNWVPSIGRSVKMPPSMMMQSWMGSDFTNDDLVRESSVIHDYTHRLLGREEVGGLEAHVVELTPKPDAPVVWGKVVMWISVAGHMQLRIDFFDEDGGLVNRLTGTEIREFDGRRIPSRLVMSPVDKPGHSTVMEYRALTFDVGLTDDFFTVQNMRRVE